MIRTTEKRDGEWKPRLAAGLSVRASEMLSEAAQLEIDAEVMLARAQSLRSRASDLDRHAAEIAAHTIAQRREDARRTA